MVTLMVGLVAADRRDAYRAACEHVAGMVGARWPSYTVLPFFDGMEVRVAAGGPEALLGTPTDHWVELGAFGTIDDAHHHLAALDRAGVDDVAIYPAVAYNDPWEQLELVVKLEHR